MVDDTISVAATTLHKLQLCAFDTYSPQIKKTQRHERRHNNFEIWKYSCDNKLDFEKQYDVFDEKGHFDYDKLSTYIQM